MSTPGYHAPTAYAIGFTPLPGATPYAGPTPYPIGGIAHFAPTAQPAVAFPNKKPLGVQPLKEVGRVRSFFPETWLWTNTTIG